MTIASPSRMTLEEYLAYDDGTDVVCELVNGVRVEMGAENDQNILIALYLLVAFSRVVPIDRLRRGTEIVISSQLAMTRYPDLLVLTEEGSAALVGSERSLITLEMPAPAVVIEVVSPGEPGSKNYDRDYVEKRQEYADRGIPEYWIIDPDRQVVWILSLQGQLYSERSFQGNAAIVSPTFPNLPLTAAQILAARP